MNTVLSRRQMMAQSAAGVAVPVAVPMAFSMPMAVLLSACQTQDQPKLDVTQQGGPLAIGVAAIDVIDDYRTPNNPLYIDDQFNPSPTDQLMSWAGRKLMPADDQGNLLVTITGASMTESDIQNDDNLKALFTNEQRLLVEVKLEAIFSFSHPQNNKSATLTVASTAQSSIADNTSPAASDAIRLRVIDQALGQFDQEFRRQVRSISSTGWPLN